MRKTLLKLLFLIVFLPLTLSGCLPTATSGEKKLQGSEFLKGAVVKGFPPVPFYPKVQVIESYSSGTSYGVSAVSSDELEKVLDFYKDAFANIGWENSLVRQTANNYLFEFKNEKNKGSVVVNLASDNKNVAITVVVESR